MLESCRCNTSILSLMFAARRNCTDERLFVMSLTVAVAPDLSQLANFSWTVSPALRTSG
jgi:hypothetical protein